MIPLPTECKIPPELVEQTKALIFGSFGGPKKFDVWLNVTADRMAHPNPADVDAFSSENSIIPPLYREWLYRPHEVLDYLLDHLNALGAWEYRVGMEGTRIQIVDALCGHVVEEAENTPEETARLSEKYSLGVRSE